jgi:ABC-type branched-subunit amino acid transport system substrate-binding protein
MADALAQLRKANVASSLFALSYVPPTLLVKVAGPQARGVALTQAFPNPNGQVMPLQRDFQATMKKFAPTVATYNAFHLEGYLCARVLVEAFKRGGVGSPEKLATALHAMGPVDIGGFTVDFSNGNNGSSFVDIGMVSADGKLMY